jgi:hypothetical protein
VTPRTILVLGAATAALLAAVGNSSGAGAADQFSGTWQLVAAAGKPWASGGTLTIRSASRSEVEAFKQSGVTPSANYIFGYCLGQNTPGYPFPPPQGYVPPKVKGWYIVTYSWKGGGKMGGCASDKTGGQLLFYGKGTTGGIRGRNGDLLIGYWTDNPAGQQEFTAKLEEEELPDALVPIEKVSNGCGGGKAGEAGIQQSAGNTSTYLNSNNPLGRRYRVNFKDACDLHDAGYSHAKVEDKLNGGIVDFLHWSQAAVDRKFLLDMRLICKRDIPASAPVARDDCEGTGGKTSFGAETRYNFVFRFGYKFFWKPPSISGRYVAGKAGVPAWRVEQHNRTVTATWATEDGGRGSFRGTLICHDDEATVEGFVKVTKGSEVVKGKGTLRVKFVHTGSVYREFDLHYTLAGGIVVRAAMTRV